MLLDALRFAVVVALVVLVPGFLLVQAAFPPRKASLTVVERTYLACAGGLLLVALVGVTLGLLPGPGLFSTSATGFPHVEVALGGLCALLAWVGASRGAFDGWFRWRTRAPGTPRPAEGSRRP